MQYALINGLRSLPQKGLVGYCATCNSKVIAKCGPIKLHHWAHDKDSNCDPWHENETLWHREWKEHFPEEFREKVLWDETLGTFHRADIHTSSGVTIEFQNSPISIEEVIQRENFYEKLIWVINGEKFEENFRVQVKIPNPNSRAFKKYEFNGRVFIDKEDLYSLGIPKSSLYRSYSVDDIISKGHSDGLSNNHFTFSWEYKRKVWLDVGKVVFIDFGKENLYWLKHIKQEIGSFWFVQLVSKVDFINKYSGLN